MKKATRAWLEFAHRDLEAARLLAGNEYLSNAVLFHSQQCVEKCLKALLEENGVPVPHIHSVVKLSALLEEEGKISISLDEDELDLVTWNMQRNRQNAWQDDERTGKMVFPLSSSVICPLPTVTGGVGLFSSFSIKIVE